MNHWMHLAASSWSNGNLKSKQFWWRLYFYFIFLIKLFFNAWQFHSHIQWNKSIFTLSPSSYSPAYPPPCLPTNFLSLFSRVLFLILQMCMSLCWYMHLRASVHRQQGNQIPLNLELQVALSHPTWVLRAELRSSTWAASAPNHWDISL